MAYKCKIYEAVNLALCWHEYFVYKHVCTGSKDIGINNENNMSNKQGIHKQSWI